MKAVVIILPILLLWGCKKTFTCECTAIEAGKSPDRGEFKVKARDRKEAFHECVNNFHPEGQFTGTPTVACDVSSK